jgi:Putative adhesin
MRASPLVSSVALGLLLAAAPPPARGSETVKTLRVELTGQEAAKFGVENLFGTTRVTPGSGPAVEIVATVHAETAELADAVRLERVGGAGTTVRVRYPYDKVSLFRYRNPSDNGVSIGWSSSESYDYDGHTVRINPGRGTRLWADLEVRVPAGRVQAAFSNLAGLIDAEGLQGDLTFRVASADLHLRRLDGKVDVAGSSGDVRARDIKGSWSSEFSSGDCQLTGFEGDLLSLHTTSGDAVLRDVRARRAEFESTSGDIRLMEADVQEFAAEASSGDVTLEAKGSSLKDVRIHTSSGDVALRLPAGLAFDVDADQSSGDMDVRFDDGTSVNHRDRIVGYRRGSGGAHIRVHTSSGDLTVTPV